MTKTRELEEAKPVKIDLTYLCPKEPNREKIIKAEGVVMPEDGPTHLGGYITDIRYTDEKKRTYAADGKQVEFVVKHKAAKWTCASCGAEKTIDPYLV